jgi:uncharacterized lipoprotein
VRGVWFIVREINIMTSNPKWILASLLALGLAGCDVEQTGEGELPEVSVQEGEMPEYEVDTADVDVESEERTVTVPDVEVQQEEETVSVPSLDVEPADAQEDGQPQG